MFSSLGKGPFLLAPLLFCVLVSSSFAEPVIFDNGYPLFDTYADVLHAHGGGILQYGGYFYYFGENRNYNSNDTFFAVSCYRSTDLKNWEFRNHVLTRDADPDLEFAKIERPKVVYCAATDKFVMWAHKEYGSDYNQARAAVAWCDTPDGDYTYVGSFNPIDPPGYMSRDCTLFVDDDANGYFLSAANDNKDLHLYKLTSDYLSIDYLVTKIWLSQWREAPCLFKRNGYYFILSSGATGWTPNQAKYGYATNLAGPWSSLYDVGNSTTYSSQSHYVLTLQGSLETSYLYMGDRWARAWSDYTDRSRYIWLPLEFTSDTNMVMNWYEAISIDTETGQISSSNESMVGWVKVDDDDPNVTYSAGWGTYYGNPGYLGTEHYSEVNDSNATFSFTSTNARYYGFLRNDLGIAEIYVDDVLQTTVDCYNRNPSYDVLLYETGTLSYGPHTLKVRVTGDADHRSDGFEIICDAFAYYKLPDDFGSFDSSTDYRLVNRHTGKNLTVSGSPKTTPGAQLQQFLHAGDTSQQWQLNEPVPTYHTITSLASGQLADIDGNSTSEGANLVQNPADGGSAQKWQLYNTGSGFHAMLNANSSLLAGIQNSSFADAAPAIQEADYDYISQQWLIFAEPDHIGRIWIEAETASGEPNFAPFTVNSGGALPEGQYIAVSNGSGDQSEPVTVGICQYNFDLANYCVAEIFLLGRAPDRYSNTYYISMDGGTYDTVTLQEHPSDFLWVKWSQFGLDAGTHTLTIALQEDGTALDKILIRTRKLLDFNADGIVNFLDFDDLASVWLTSDPEYDVVPYSGDGSVDAQELKALANDWLK